VAPQFSAKKSITVYFLTSNSNSKVGRVSKNENNVEDRGLEPKLTYLLFVLIFLTL
jgi:hypothetical protein